MVTWLGLRSLHVRQFKPEPQLSATTLYDLLKVAFAVAVGIGGVVALVTAYRRQRVAEFAHELAARIEDRADRGEEENQKLAARTEEREATRLLNERFATAAGQLGSESPAVRLAGIYAMAGLADNWPQRRQTCVDVLCAYLRMPYAPEPAADAAQPDRQAYQATQEVRHTAIRIITAHLAPYRRPATPQDWCGLDLDFTGTIFDSGTVDFSGAQFTGGTVNFRDAQFTGGTVNFSSAQFTGGTVNFSSAQFTGATVNFRDAQFTGATVDFSDAQFAGGTVYFSDAQSVPGTRFFHGQAQFADGTVYFRRAQFTGGTVDFSGAWFTGGTVDFRDAQFTGATVDFSGAWFTGATVDFRDAQFTGGTVYFSDAEWRVPPILPAWDVPPTGVFLPGRAQPGEDRGPRPSDTA